MRDSILPEVVHAELGSGVVAGLAVVPCAVAAVVQRGADAAVEAGAATCPDSAADEAVGDECDNYIVGN